MTPRKDRNIRLVDGRWMIDFTFRGKRHREFGGWNKAQAANTLIKLRSELLDVARGFKKAAVEDVPFEKFADTFLETYCRPNKRAPERDEVSLAHLKPFFKDKTLKGITAQDIAGYLAARRTEAAPATCNRELATLKTLLTKATEWGKIEASPAAKVRRFKEPPSRERFLTRDEAGRLISAATPALRPFLILLLATGMRRGEALNLAWTDVDLVRGTITIRMSKSGRPRTVPMAGELSAVLGALPKHGPNVFMNGRPGESITGIKEAFRAACRAAKIEGLRIHDLRHTFASRALEAGADLMSVSKILGHASIAMTAKYAHAGAEGPRKAVNLMGEFLASAASTRQNLDTPSGTTITVQPVIPLKQND